MKNLIFLIAALFLMNPKISLAEIGVKNFSFKGYRFGDSPKPEPYLMPWEAHPAYPRLGGRIETDIDSLYFGDFPLGQIKYMYLYEKLFEINVSFKRTTGCENSYEIYEMLKVRYGVNISHLNFQNGRGYQGRFANQEVSIEVECSPSISLDELNIENENSKSIGKSTTIEHDMSIVFRDAAAFKRSKVYISNLKEQKKKELKDINEKKIRNKINF